jgi:COP9 signalosome complex subunit 12
MNSVFEEFKQAYRDGEGYRVAATISPIPPANNGGRLYAFYKSSNSFDIQNAARTAIIYQNDLDMTRPEGTAWVDVFVSYWKAIGILLAAEEADASGRSRGREWSGVYSAWKELCNMFIKGHTAGSFPAWTLPCLYIVAKSLRVFAIKADEQLSREQGDVTFSSGYGDDIVASSSQTENLEDCARVLTRMFSLCQGDRAPIEESRKWGIYYITNLLFKTHFKVSDCRNTVNNEATLMSCANLYS